MINTALSSPGPNSRFFLCRPTMEHVHGVLLEHVYGILLDEKFLYRSVHAAFVNTKWYEAWLERTLLLDPIIFDMFVPGVLSWAPGDPCNSHHARHDLSRHSLCSVSTPWVLFSITSRSVAAAAASSLSRFSCSPSCRGDSVDPWLESIARVSFCTTIVLFTHVWLSLMSSLCVSRVLLSTTIARVSFC